MSTIHDIMTSSNNRQHNQVMGKDKKAGKGDKGNKGNKKNTSLRLESKTLKALKLRAIEEDTSVQAIIENLIDQYLGKKIKLKTISK